jgi:hypothetical protein
LPQNLEQQMRTLGHFEVLVLILAASFKIRMRYDRFRLV